MDLSKLKIDSFQNFCIKNFPETDKPELPSTESDVEVIQYYINKIRS